jgi:hypothetical protein
VILAGEVGKLGTTDCGEDVVKLCKGEASGRLPGSAFGKNEGRPIRARSSATTATVARVPMIATTIDTSIR